MILAQRMKETDGLKSVRSYSGDSVFSVPAMKLCPCPRVRVTWKVFSKKFSLRVLSRNEWMFPR